MKEDKFTSLRGKLLSGRVYPEFFPLDPSDRVVNVGCGEGPQAIVYAGHYKEMIGVDISSVKLERANEAAQVYGVHGFTTLQANVEDIPVTSGSFDKAIAVDVIEHVQNPRQLCLEARRLLKDGGEMLMTFPAMHDKYIRLGFTVGRLILRRRRKEPPSTEWDPGIHNHEYPVSEWVAIVESCGFKLLAARASTLFPPLHAYGVPRFWFRSNVIHRVDSLFCKIWGLRNYGQALVCIFAKGRQAPGS